MLRWVVPLLLGAFVFVAGLTLDTAGLIRLFWASAIGYFGVTGRVLAAAVALTCAAPALLKLYRYLVPPATARAPGRRPARPRATTRREVTAEKPSRVVVEPGPRKPPRQSKASDVGRDDLAASGGRGPKRKPRPQAAPESAESPV